MTPGPPRNDSTGVSLPAVVGVLMSMQAFQDGGGGGYQLSSGLRSLVF